MNTGNELEKLILYGIVVAIIAIFGFSIFCEYEQGKFKDDHHCINIGEAESSTYFQYAYGDKGQIVAMYPVTITSYLFQCDDGKHRF